MCQIINLNRRPHVHSFIYVGRPSKTGDQLHHFGNPFGFGHARTRATVNLPTRDQAIQAYSDWLAGAAWQEVEPDRRAWILANLHYLRGKTLACWCAPNPCHAEILVKLAEKL